jgi:hypothetical protein
MKRLKLFMLVLAGAVVATNANAQANASINVLTQNSGNVFLGSTVNIQVTVGNTGPVSSIGVYKVRVQISVPSAIVNILPNAEQFGLPSGWTINSNSGSVINLSNGTDVIPVGVQRTILIAIRGNVIGGPSTVSGQLNFSNGNAPGTAPGTLAGDITADNTSQSSVTVVNPIPVTLSNFSATLSNCQPVLKWTTQTEINSDKFELQRTTNNGWSTIATIAAQGNSSTAKNYSFTDASLTTTAVKLQYRLKMIDKDGTITYSPILPVNLNCNTRTLSVFPNPVQDGKLYISLNGATGRTESALQSVSGQTMRRAVLNNGTNVLNLSGLASGMYILQITDGNGSNEKMKIIVQ